jgi:hypothetical protein
VVIRETQAIPELLVKQVQPDIAETKEFQAKPEILEPLAKLGLKARPVPTEIRVILATLVQRVRLVRSVHKGMVE